MEMVHPPLPKRTSKNWKAQDWIEHASFGLGQVSESREDKLDIDFVSTGRKTILKSTELKPAASPGLDFNFSSIKGKSRSSRIKVERLTRAPQKIADGLPASPGKRQNDAD